MNADHVRAKAAQLVRSHAARLGMDNMAAAVLAQAIENIPTAADPARKAAIERHNTLGAELFAKLVEGTPDETEAYTVLESLIYAVMLLYRPDPQQAGEVLDTMTAAVIERMGQ